MPAVIAYFSMEIGVESNLPTYAGGLGILAGDTLRAGADLGLPMVAVTLVHRRGYFHQRLDERGWQHDVPVNWNLAEHLTPTAATASVSIDGREVLLRAWRRDILGAGGHAVPVYFLDADVEGNDAGHRRLTDHLYGGDHGYRLRQEIILGVGGVRILRALGHTEVGTYHMNEGHACLLAAELLRERALTLGTPIDSEHAARGVRERCVFTTHTPVAAGHDRFALDMVRQAAGDGAIFARSPFFVRDGHLDTTHAALTLSRYANAVALRHGEVARRMFPAATIDSITNGVHAATWAAPSTSALLDAKAPGWKADNDLIARAASATDAEIQNAHDAAKTAFLQRINRDANAGFERGALTIGVARRATPYKRLDLILSDLGRLGAIATAHGPIQIAFAGKAHPRDGGGRDLIHHIQEVAGALPAGVRIVFVPGYDMDLAALMVAGCDLWLNTPQRPLEASGTSGMKAAVNGVPSLSILDGWWVEGCTEGETGWAIGPDRAPGEWEADRAADAADLYDKLAHVAGLYSGNRAAWIAAMRGAMAVNGPRFSTHRMIREYAAKAYGIK